MFRIAAGTLRERWPVLTGTFIAIAIGAALMIAAVQLMINMDSATDSGPQRFAATPVVVAGSTSLDPAAIPDGRIPRRRAVPEGLTLKIAVQPGVERVVADRSFIVRFRDTGQDTLGRPWSAHQLAPYDLTAGRAPAAADEVVVTDGTSGTELGGKLRVLTPGGLTDLRVVGTARPGPGLSPGIERPLFFSDTEAARLAPTIDAFGVWPAAAAPAVGDALADSPGFTVLTGPDRAKIEPDPDGLAAAGGSALLGIIVMTICFVAMFVIASTSSLAVALRRRELGLLRAIGATPAQTRRLVLRENLLLALIAAAAGAALSLIVSPALAGWLSDNGLTPAGMSRVPNPAAMLIGGIAVLPIAVTGSYLTARRAGRLRPTEALRDAAVDRGVMTLTRWIVGVPCIAAAIAVPLAVGFDADPEVQLPLTFLEAMLLVTGLTMLAPAFAPRIGRLLTLPLRALPGAGPTLVGEWSATSIRRTAALAAPVLLAIGLTASLASALDSLDATDAAVADARIMPGVTTIAATGAGGLTGGDVDAFAGLEGVETGAALQADVVIKPGLDLGPQIAGGVDPGGVALGLRAPLARGDLGDLQGDSMALSESAAQRYGAGVGTALPVWLPDGTARMMKVVAVLRTGFDLTSIWMPRELLAEHNGPTAATAIYAKPVGPDGASGIRRLANERALRIETSNARRSADPTYSSNMNGLALQAILGVALIYVVIALITTAAITTAARRSELASLRLTGGTRAQTALFIGAETLLSTGIGGLLGLMIGLIVKLGMDRTANLADGPAVVVMPWGLLLVIWAVCAAAAASAAVLSALRTQRAAPHTLVA